MNEHILDGIRSGDYIAVLEDNGQAVGNWALEHVPVMGSDVMNAMQELCGHGMMDALAVWNVCCEHAAVQYERNLAQPGDFAVDIPTPDGRMAMVVRVEFLLVFSDEFPDLPADVALFSLVTVESLETPA